ncbi:ethanolamine ammonia-lyase subunit EutC [Raineyella sp. W15-4]|uniref:ethanolamine ammonia-lyase subunit EutC n=1 Tax=Raineyella sp. W15-4 TaxID=3081651 RepID=UPI002953FF5E|nr:ethanolamine ammonia-lyase subunit EutC [Raineyella sp. W15-4]WOQ16584.1 ethanolamine ammonia-lyase subunit EutC [Raineyella sp. W15-4]
MGEPLLLHDESADPADGERAFWDLLRTRTQARIGLGHAGDSLPTTAALTLRAAHAAARDAIHLPLDVATLAAEVATLGIGPASVITSRAADRAEYLRRPDLGKLPADLPHPSVGADIGILIADGLSPRAVTDHAVGQLAALLIALPKNLVVARPVIATNARVALGDRVGRALGATTMVVLIGERPGLSVVDSLGIYLTHLPGPGRTDADRNCISNIHPPSGLSYQRAAAIAANLVVGARALGRSGVDLKDTSAMFAPLDPDAQAPLLPGGRGR